MNNSFGPRLRRFRKEKGLTQQELADRSNVSNTLISRLENQVIQDPRLSTIRQLANALEISISKLLGNDESESSLLDRVLQKLRAKKALLHNRFHVKRLGIFGSTARMEASPEGDIDLLVKYEEGHRDIFNHSRLETFLEQELEHPIDLVMESEEPRRDRPHIRNNIEQDLIHV